MIEPSLPSRGGEVPGTLVLGVGNPLIGDDGVGLVALGRLRAGWRVEPPVQLVDGGTWGMNLLPLIEDARRLLILDAIDLGIEPGTLAVLERDALPRYLGLKLSPHQIDLREVLALAHLRGTLPADALAIGLQPASLVPEVGLSAPVRAGMAEMNAEVRRRLVGWGHVVTRVGSGQVPAPPEVAWTPEGTRPDPVTSRAAPGTAPGSRPCS